MLLCVDGWSAEVSRRLRRRDHGRDRVGGVERPDRARARADGAPSSSRPGAITDDPNQRVPEADRATTRVVYTGLFIADAGHRRLSTKPQLVHVVPRRPRVPAAVHRGLGGADRGALLASTRCSTSSGRCGARPCCPAPRSSRQQYLGITGNTVEDWMKDLQIDATALPGKAFDLTVRDARARRRHHDVQPLRCRRPVGGDGPARHPREELPLDLPQVDDRHDARCTTRT